MIRAVVADDHPIVREGIRNLLDARPEIEVVAAAADGAEVVRVLATVPCDVVVLDLSLPHLRGLELVQLVRERHPDVGIVVFTLQHEDLLGRSLAQLGIMGFVRKDRPVEELVTAVLRAGAGQRTLPVSLERPSRGARGGLPHLALSPREAQVLERLATGATVKEIAQELEITASTTSNHVARIREKLGVRTNGEIVLYASRHDLVE